MKSRIHRRTLIVCGAAAMLAACATYPGTGGITEGAPAPMSPGASAAIEAGMTPPSTIGQASDIPPPLSTFTAQPSASPTPGPRVTRTPAPAEDCPAAGGSGTTISLRPDPRSPADSLEPQIRAYLNARGSAGGLQAELERLRVLAEGFEWEKETRVLVVDVTGDSVPDVLVEFVVHASDLGGAVFVFGCREGSFDTLYRRAIGGAQHRPLGPEDGIVAVADMNADGLAEVVIAEVTNVSARGYVTREFQVLEWDGLQFAYLVEPDGWRLSPASSFDAPGRVEDMDGDGTLELLLPQAIVPEYPDSGPQRLRTDIWAWTGTAFELARWEYEPPTYRFQAVQDGDQAALLGEFDRALELYQQAIDDDELLGWNRGRMWPDNWYNLSLGGGPQPTPTRDPAEPLRLDAYARYRILLLYTAQGDLAEAGAAYESLQALFQAGSPGHPFAQMAAAFWNAFKLNSRMNEGCRSATTYAEAHASEILEPLGNGFYGWFNRDYAAEEICPFR